jgi:molybdenum cofactor cytidylyltransferase
MNIIAIILAAGNSSRMGTAKIALSIGDQSLLDHCIHQALGSTVTHIIVIEGAYPIDTIADQRVTVVKNQTWRSGIGSSIKAGVVHVNMYFPNTDAVIFLVADQPFVTSHHITKLTTTFKSTGKITASFYSNSPGVPALFPKSTFVQVLSIADHHGAKAILEENKGDLSLIDFPEGATDLDTPEDYREYLDRIQSPKSKKPSEDGF